MKSSYLLKTFFFLIGIFVLGCFYIAYFAPVPIPQTKPGIIALAAFEDKSASLAFEEVSSPQTLFYQTAGTTIHRGITRSVLWARFLIDAPAEAIAAGDRYLEIRNSNLQQISVYFPCTGPEGQLTWTVIEAGKKVPINRIQIPGRIWMIPIPDTLQKELPVYIRVQTSTIMWIPLRVIDSQILIRHTIQENLFFGIFFGILCAMFITNLFSYMLIRNKVFLLYAGYLFFLLLYAFRVHGFLYYFNLPHSLYDKTVWPALSGMGIFLILFAQRFLGLRKRLPVINILLWIGILLFVVQLVTGISGFGYLTNKLAYITGFIVPILILSATITVYLRGFKEARFYLLAWFPQFMGTVIWATAAYRTALIPAAYFFMIGTALDSLLFTLAIFDLVRTQLREKEEGAAREKYYLTLSRVDTLTGLYNRRYLNETVKRLEREKDGFADISLIMIDLDDFKLINDTLGHPAGDTVLIRLAELIRSRIRKTDIPCRLGGDEFIILVPGADTDIAQRIAQSILDDVRKGILMEGHEHYGLQHNLYCGISIGITGTRMDDSFDGFLLRADMALYKAKHEGKNRIVVV